VDVFWDYDMKRSTALHAGILIKPSERFRIGAAFRSALFHHLVAYSTTRVNILGVVTEYRVRIDAVNWYSPMQAALGAVYETAAFSWAADVTWYNWSDYPGYYNKVEILEAPGSGLMTGAQAPDPRFKDTVTPRVGMEWRIAEQWALRLGYAFNMTPAPLPSRRYDVLDCDRHTITVGAGAEVGSESWPLGIDFALQVHLLQRRRVLRSVEPRELVFGGAVIDAGLTLMYRF